MYYLLCGCAFCFWFMQALLKGNDRALYGNSRKYRYRRSRKKKWFCPGNKKNPLCRAGVALRKGFSVILGLVLV